MRGRCPTNMLWGSGFMYLWSGCIWLSQLYMFVHSKQICVNVCVCNYKQVRQHQHQQCHVTTLSTPMTMQMNEYNTEPKWCQSVIWAGYVFLYWWFIITSTNYFLLGFLFFFVINITHPWSMPHAAAASFCSQGSNGFGSHMATVTASNTPLTATFAAATSHSTTNLPMSHCS